MQKNCLHLHTIPLCETVYISALISYAYLILFNGISQITKARNAGDYFSLLLTVTERLFIWCLFLKDWRLRASTESLDSAIQWKKWKWRLTKVFVSARSIVTGIACMNYDIADTEHFRLKINWHISEGLRPIWDCRFDRDMHLSRRGLGYKRDGISGTTNNRCPLTALDIAVK